MPLTEDEASLEMRKMIAFITQEATEKAREIQVKADEEFNIEKAKLVRQETQAIESQYDRKFKQAQIKQKIARSGQVNKTRLQVLQGREGVLEGIREGANQAIAKIRSDGNYGQLMTNLILQSLYRLDEELVQVQCLAVDQELVKSIIPQVCKAYQGKVQIQVDVNHALPEQSLGGVVVTGLKGRIRCDNTLASRLTWTADKLMPAIRTHVFGPPASRAFFD